MIARYRADNCHGQNPYKRLSFSMVPIIPAGFANQKHADMVPIIPAGFANQKHADTPLS